MTRAQQELTDAIARAIASGDWKEFHGIHGAMAMWSEERPNTHHKAIYGADKYTRFVQVRLSSGKPYVRISRAPWVNVQDSFVTFQRALEVLADPAAAC